MPLFTCESWDFIAMPEIIHHVLAGLTHCMMAHAVVYSGGPNRRTGLLIYFSFFADLTKAYLALPFYFFMGHLAACTKFQSDWPTETINKPCDCWLFYLPFMGTLSFDFCIYGSHYSHTACWKPIFIENSCFCKRIKPRIICSPDLIFGLAELLVTLTLHTALPLHHLEDCATLNLYSGPPFYLALEVFESIWIWIWLCPENPPVTLGSRIAIPVRQLILTFFSHRYDAYSGQYVN